MDKTRVFFVFDVESIGLHGEGYAVAGGVFFEDGSYDPFCEFSLACPPESAMGDESDRKWVAANVPPLKSNHACPFEIRSEFWKIWLEAKRLYPSIIMAGECVWPVESGFLSACVQDDLAARKWEGPYPLHEIASVMTAGGMDPMATYDRLENELPKHHPLADARQSARLLCAALRNCGMRAIPMNIPRPF